MNNKVGGETVVKLLSFIFVNTADIAYPNDFPQSMRPDCGKLRKNKGNVYYNILTPVFCVLTVCGVFPFFRHGSDLSRRMQYFVVIYSATVHLTVTGFTVFTIMTAHGAEDSDFQFNLLESLFAIQHLIYLTATWPESRHVTKFLEEWTRFQECFENVTGMDVNLKNVQIWIRVTSFLIILWTFINFFILFLLHPGLGLGKICLFNYHGLLSLTFLQLWYFSYSAIFNTAVQYGKHFKEKCMLNIPSECQLEDFRLLWIQMSNVVRQAGNMLAFTMLYFISTTAVINVYSAFDVTVNALSDVQDGSFEGDNLWDGLSPFVVTSLFLFLFYSSGFNSVEKSAVINSYLVNMKLTRASFLNEVELFMKTLRILPPVCNLKGFTSVDRNSMLLGSGALFTYLVILIQFYISRTAFTITES